MPSFKSGLRNSYRVSRRSSREVEESDDPEGRLRGYGRRRGGSLPVNCSSISVKLLPSLCQPLTDADAWKSKAIPKDVIETDYLVRPVFAEEILSSDEKLEAGDDKIQTESSSRQNAIDQQNSSLHPDVCREFSKAFLDALAQRVISRRGGRGTGEANSYSLLLNADLLDRVSADVARMSHREPLGLSGCRLRTRVERQDSADMDLGCVRIDPDAEETFEIVLSLKESQKTPERRTPGLIGNISSLLSNVLRNPRHRGGRVRPVEVHLSHAYQLEKIRLRKFSDATNCIGLCSA